MALGKRLKQAREHRKLKQEQLSELMPENRRASQAMISALEKRDSETTTLLFEFADALNCNPRWLQIGDPEDSWLDRVAPDPSDKIYQQLVDIYWKHLDNDSRHKLVGYANGLGTKDHTEPSQMAPYLRVPLPMAAEPTRKK